MAKKPLRPSTVDAKKNRKRLRVQVERLISAIEQVDIQAKVAEATVPQLLNSLYMVGRLEWLLNGMERRTDTNDPRESGTAVRKYAAAFQNAAGARAADPGTDDALAAALDDETDGTAH